MAKCEICGQYFRTKVGLKMHLRTCENDKLTDKLLVERTLRQDKREIKHWNKIMY